MSAASHELRTPIAVIRHVLEVARTSDSPDWRDDRRQRVGGGHQDGASRRRPAPDRTDGCGRVGEATVGLRSISTTSCSRRPVGCRPPIRIDVGSGLGGPGERRRRAAAPGGSQPARQRDAPRHPSTDRGRTRQRRRASQPSRSTTTVPASRPRIASGSSNGSCASTSREPGPTEGSDSDSRSWPSWWTHSVVTFASRPANASAGPDSSSPCPTPEPESVRRCLAPTNIFTSCRSCRHHRHRRHRRRPHRRCSSSTGRCVRTGTPTRWCGSASAR